MSVLIRLMTMTLAKKTSYKEMSVSTDTEHEMSFIVSKNFMDTEELNTYTSKDHDIVWRNTKLRVNVAYLISLIIIFFIIYCKN